MSERLHRFYRDKALKVTIDFGAAQAMHGYSESVSARWPRAGTSGPLEVVHLELPRHWPGYSQAIVQDSDHHRYPR